MGKYTAFDLDILSININQLNTENYTHKPTNTMEYAQIAKHVTSRQVAEQSEQYLTKTTRTTQQKTQAVIEHFNEVFTSIGTQVLTGHSTHRPGRTASCTITEENSVYTQRQTGCPSTGTGRGRGY